jgi:hypothetical protein
VSDPVASEFSGLPLQQARGFVGGLTPEQTLWHLMSQQRFNF